MRRFGDYIIVLRKPQVRNASMFEAAKRTGQAESAVKTKIGGSGDAALNEATELVPTEAPRLEVRQPKLRTSTSSMYILTKFPLVARHDAFRMSRVSFKRLLPSRFRDGF